MIDSIRQALERGFHRETLAKVRYELFAQKAAAEAELCCSEAEKDLFLEAALLFRQIAQDEQSHAMLYLKVFDEIGDTLQNIQQAVETEQNDRVEYAISSTAAQSEGHAEIALIFERIAAAENRHIELFTALSGRMQEIWLNTRLTQVQVPEHRSEESGTDKE